MLIKPDRSLLFVIDLQERLLPAIHEGGRVIDNARILLKAAARLSLPIIASEQYPKGLGPSVPPVAELLPQGAVAEKIHFSCMADAEISARVKALGRPQVVVCGTEAHVCVLQTVMGLLAAGYDTFVVADAVSSRTPANHRAALDRMARVGAEIVTTEMVVFEWMERAGTPEFKELSGLIK